jgi:1-acyl-sn-glycerol-3-phosphate acyltransferase
VIRLVKTAALFSLLLLYLLSSLAVVAAPLAGRTRRRFFAATTSFFCRQGLGVLGIRAAVRGTGKEDLRRRNHLIVSNHLSYVDILIISSLAPSAFITSVELKHTFLLGLLARFGGSLFVERRSPAGLKREIAEITRALKEGLTVVLFPEGTTSNGDSVRPFRNSLFTAATETGTDILPLCLKYTRVDGRPLGRGNRDSIFYYGGTSFFEHLPRLLSLRSVDVECTILTPIPALQRDSRKDLARTAHHAISAVYASRNSAGEKEKGQKFYENLRDK